MEEAEALCDRIGIFVGGRLSCIDNPQELTARYGDYLSFSLSVPPKQAEAACEAIAMYVHGAHLIHSLGGTLKMELPSASVDVGQLFEYMDKLKRGGTLQVRDWGVSHATLEEVFIRITRDA
ncbi:MAG: ABC transporter A family member, partial [Trebouxia sp. A1-2]